MNVLIIPEDFRKDQFILKPIVKAIFAFIGKPQANVRVCHNPLLGGIDQALTWERIAEIIELYNGMTQIFLLLVDRDGKEGRRDALTTIEEKAASALGKKCFLAENAFQEVEAWLLAGINLPNDWRWPEIREEIHVKERFFERLAHQRLLEDGPGGGRKTLGVEAARNYPRIRLLCEEIASLESRIAAVLK